ncbi:MAG: hypothetical protein ABI877_09745 [Gemmatimonadaceae bacterium]
MILVRCLVKYSALGSGPIIARFLLLNESERIGGSDFGGSFAFILGTHPSEVDKRCPPDR